MPKTAQLTALQMEHRERWQKGDRIRLEAFLEQHPGLRKDPEGMLDLIYQEVVLREEEGEHPQVEEYVRRFPSFATELRRQFEVHQAINGGSGSQPVVGARTNVGNGNSVAAHTPIPGGLTGQVLADFRVGQLLGKGGMGEVSLAEQTSLKRPVALKVLRQEMAANPAAFQRFRAEAEAVARATHPNIVQVYAVGESGGVQFMAMEYVEGKSLRDYLAKKGKLEVPVALTMMRQVAAALQRASDLGIVHRDIKPDNILLTARGEVKVADFGLARDEFRKRPVRLTELGTAIGTPVYMSPEQFQGQPVDVRSDIYSFGATCYHALGGKVPFKGETPLELALNHVEKVPEPLEKLRPDLPPGLANVIHKMLAKNPADRYQTARELSKDIAKIRAGMSATYVGEAQPDLSAARRSDPWIVRSVVLAAILLATAAGIGLGVWLHCRDDDHGQPESSTSSGGLGAPPGGSSASVETSSSAVSASKTSASAPADSSGSDSHGRHRHGGRDKD